MSKKWIASFAVAFMCAAANAAAASPNVSQEARASAQTAQSSQSQPSNYFSQFAQVKETCFKSGEQTSGMNKICYYKCNSGDAAITISSVSLCPLSIQK